MPNKGVLLCPPSLNALDASEYFRLPPNRVVEIGLQVEI